MHTKHEIGRHMPHWGCIADDYTGATDLATNFVSQGFRTVVMFGAPAAGDQSALTAAGEADVVVVALKSRTAPVAQATAESLAALEFLRTLGAERYYVKYCSTFDSTPTGNIGPVIDGVLDALAEDLTIVVPAFPRAGRVVTDGRLFVNGVPLEESSMRDHPLTPMRDSSVPRLLAPQTANQVELITEETLREGAEAVSAEVERIRSRGGRWLVVIDTADDADLLTIAEATRGLAVVTGGSGLALGYSPVAASGSARSIPVAQGRRAVLCGSASQMTRAQVAHAKQTLPWQKLDRVALDADFDGAVTRHAEWARDVWERDPAAVPVFFSVETLEDIDPADASASELVEHALGAIAQQLVAAGARQLIVAGGETSGRVVGDLGVSALRIGPEIAAGVAWASARDASGNLLNLALKSGNFGDETMFTTAWEVLA